MNARHMDKQHQMIAAARRYHEANVKTWVAGNAISHQLREECADARWFAKMEPGSSIQPIAR